MFIQMSNVVVYIRMKQTATTATVEMCPEQEMGSGFQLLVGLAEIHVPRMYGGIVRLATIYVRDMEISMSKQMADDIDDAIGLLQAQDGQTHTLKQADLQPDSSDLPIVVGPDAGIASREGDTQGLVLVTATAIHVGLGFRH